MYTHAHIIPIANPIPAAAAGPLRIAVVARDRFSRAGLAAPPGPSDNLIVEEPDVDDFLPSRIRVMRPDALLADGDAGDLRNLEPAGVVLFANPRVAAGTTAT